MLPSVIELVAQFLRANGFSQTLTQLIEEAGLPSNVGTFSDQSITIESILIEKRIFDKSLTYEKFGPEDGTNSWNSPAPSIALEVASIPDRSNILGVFEFELSLPSKTSQPFLVVTTADRRIHMLDLEHPELALVRTYSGLVDSPILDIHVLASRFMLVASMSGKLLLYDVLEDNILDVRQDHSKYLVKLAAWTHNDSVLVASAGWDSQIFLYKLDLKTPRLCLGTPLTSLSLPTLPETILFVVTPEENTPLLLVARRDSTHLHYYSIPSAEQAEMILLGKQNLSPHSHTWVAFSPCDIQTCPTDSSLVAIATSHTPIMRIIVVKLLLPAKHIPTLPAERDRGYDQVAALQMRGLAEVVTTGSSRMQEVPVLSHGYMPALKSTPTAEHNAVKLDISTQAPQSLFSSPRLSWRSDGSGIFVNSEDGVIRGLETSSGKLISTLVAHKPGAKVRCLLSSSMKTGTSEQGKVTKSREYLITGGFDQRLYLWS